MIRYFLPKKGPNVKIYQNSSFDPVLRDAGVLVGQGASRKVRALVSEGKPKNGGWGASTGNLLVPCPLDWLKMILRKFQLTEPIFF